MVANNSGRSHFWQRALPLAALGAFAADGAAVMTLALATELAINLLTGVWPCPSAKARFLLFLTPVGRPRIRAWPRP